DEAPARKPWTRGRDVVLIAACFAALAACVEAGLDGFRILVAHKIVFKSPDLALLTPLAYVICFVPLALLLAAAARLRRRGVPVAVSVAVFAGLAVVCLLMPFTQIALWASAFVAAGLGFQIGRVASSN